MLSELKTIKVTKNLAKLAGYLIKDGLVFDLTDLRSGTLFNLKKVAPNSLKKILARSATLIVEKPTCEVMEKMAKQNYKG